MKYPNSREGLLGIICFDSPILLLLKLKSTEPFEGRDRVSSVFLALGFRQSQVQSGVSGVL